MSPTTISAAVLNEIIADPVALDRLALALDARAAARSTSAIRDVLLTPASAAAIAGLHERTIRRALAAGTLRGSKRAGRWRIELTDLEAWIANGAPTARTESITIGRPRRNPAGLKGAEAIAGTGQEGRR